MAERNGNLVSVEFTLTGGDTVTAEDSALDAPRYGTAAFEAFKRGDKVIPTGGDSPCWLNFYAIVKACVTLTPASQEFEDDNCVAASE